MFNIEIRITTCCPFKYGMKIKSVKVAETGVKPSGFVKKYSLYISLQAQLFRISALFILVTN